MSSKKSPDRAEYGTVRTALRQAIAAHPGDTFTVTDIVELLDIGLSRSRTGIALAAMVRSGELQRVAPGTFARSRPSAPANAVPTAPGSPTATADSASASEPSTVQVQRPYSMRRAGELEQYILLRDDDGNLWAARPANIAEL